MWCSHFSLPPSAASTLDGRSLNSLHLPTFIWPHDALMYTRMNFLFIHKHKCKYPCLFGWVALVEDNFEVLLLEYFFQLPGYFVLTLSILIPTACQCCLILNMTKIILIFNQLLILAQTMILLLHQLPTARRRRLGHINKPYQQCRTGKFLLR